MRPAPARPKAGDDIGADPNRIGPADFDAPTIRAAFNAFARALETVRAEWIDGDRRLVELKASMGPETGSFEQMGRDERSRIDDLIRDLKLDVIPFILSHADPSLRDRIQGVMRLIDLDEYMPDRYGEERQRWRQMWPTTGLQPEFEELSPMLRAAGDAVVLQASAARARVIEPPAPPESPVKHASDFGWIIVGPDRYDFTTLRQREIIKVLYEGWEHGGDGSPMTEAAILEDLNLPTERLRVADRFKDSPALGRILVRVEGKEAAWALYLRADGAPDHK